MKLPVLVVVAAALGAAASFGLGDDGMAVPAMWGIERSLGRPDDVAAASCGEPPSTSLSVWLDGRSIDGTSNSSLANNDPITTWQDLGSVNDDPTQATGAAKPTFIASCLNGKACARFDGGDRLAATTASNYIFLNSGVDWTGYVVFRAGSANPNAAYALITTKSTADGNAGRGFSMIYDDRAASTREDQGGVYISTGAVPNITNRTADDALSQQTWHIFAHKLDDDGGGGVDSFNFVDGAAAGTASQANAYSNFAPVGALSVGAETDAGLPFTGDLVQVLLYAVAHDDATRGVVETWIECVYGGLPAP